MSYMLREALVETYPDIFADANRYIRKPRKPKPIQEKTTIQTSYATGEVTVVGAESADE